MSNGNITVGNMGGDLIGGHVEGSGHTFGKNITVSSPIINSQQAVSVSNEYAKSLQNFSELVNQQLRMHDVPAERVAPIQEGINELAKEIEDIKLDQKIAYTKKATIKAKLAALAEGLLKVLPKAAEITAAFSPLAPFSKLVGEGIEEIVKAVQES